MFALALAWTGWYSVDTLRQMQHRDALRTSGMETTGDVTRLWSSGHGMYHKVSYTFTVNGTVFAGEALAPKENWDSLQDRGSLLVRYLSTNPAINHPGAWEWSVLQRFDLIAAAIFAIALGVFFLWDLAGENSRRTKAG
jgi:hypothetical protein